jgi:signal transduction histidine kinase
VEVLARRDADMLCLEVTDSGDAAAASSEPHGGSGLGLRATRERLAHMFGAAFRVDLEIEDGRSHAAIQIPFRTGAAA